MSLMDGKQIHIAYVVNDLKLGGAQMMILELASKLNREKFVATVYYLNRNYGDSGNLEAEFKKAGVSTICISPALKVGLIKSSYRLFKLWRRHTPDVVHAHLPYAVMASTIASIFISKIKVVVHEHQSPSHFSLKIRCLRSFLRFFSNLTICYSEGVEKDIFGRAHILKNPPDTLASSSYTIHNGVDVGEIQQLQVRDVRQIYRQELRCADEDVLIIAIARLIPWKGQEVLLDAFLSLAAKKPNIKLCLVGSGLSREVLEKKVVASGFSDRVIVTGDRKDALSLLCAADIASLVYVYPKGKEGDSVGIAGCEAMAMGLPLLAGSDLHIISGLEHDKNILLVEPGNKEALASALTVLIEDAVLRKRLGDEARIFAERNLNWLHIVPIYERIYLLVSKV